jgi:hypothetical protein
MRDEQREQKFWRRFAGKGTPESFAVVRRGARRS